MSESTSQQRFLKQQKSLLLYTLVLGVALFIALTNFASFDDSTTHRYQLALYLTFILDISVTVILLAIMVTGSYYTSVQFDNAHLYYQVATSAVTILLTLTAVLFCWMLWELARLYDVTLGNDLLSQYLSFIPMGVFALTGVWMAAVWFCPARF